MRKVEFTEPEQRPLRLREAGNASRYVCGFDDAARMAPCQNPAADDASYCDAHAKGQAA